MAIILGNRMHLYLLVRHELHTDSNSRLVGDLKFNTPLNASGSGRAQKFLLEVIIIWTLTAVSKIEAFKRSLSIKILREIINYLLDDSLIDLWVESPVVPFLSPRAEPTSLGVEQKESLSNGLSRDKDRAERAARFRKFALWIFFWVPKRVLFA